MCRPDSHVFLFHAPTRATPIPIGLPCLCGAHRWGTEAELRALDEVAWLEALAAVPWHETTRWP